MAKRKKIKRKTTTTKSPFLKNLLLIGFASLLLAAVYYYYSKDQKVTINKQELISEIPTGFPSFGIDVSHHQGAIDWEELMFEEGYDSLIHFVYCKATEGLGHVDTQWETNREVLSKLGKPHGAYHFFSTITDPKQQASHFLNYWKPQEGDLPPVLDVETESTSDKELIANMKIWLNEVEQKSGLQPVIYTSLHFFETKFKEVFKDYKFWIAAYSRTSEFTEDSRVIHWQYSETGHLPGLSEAVDLNVSKISFR